MNRFTKAMLESVFFRIIGIVLLVAPVVAIVLFITSATNSIALTGTANLTAMIANNLQLLDSYVWLFIPIMAFLIFLARMFSCIAFIGGDLGEISRLRNTEKRMQKLKQMGAQKFINDTKATLIDANSQGIELYSTFELLKNHTEIRFTVYRDTSTRETYMSFVPPEMKTADEAMAWKQRLTVEQYRRMNLQS